MAMEIQQLTHPDANPAAVRLAGLLRPRVDALLRGRRVRSALGGGWLGHPVHPVLTDLPIGFWTSAWVLDLTGHRDAARSLIGLGVISALPTAVTGANDWLGLDRRKDAAAMAHLAANATATALYFLSWRQRRRGHHALGIVTANAGALAATLGGYLGGHLAFGPPEGEASAGDGSPGGVA
jgi:uncharacterized membrane protein